MNNKVIHALYDDDDVLITVKRKGYAFNSQYVSSKDTSFNSPSRIDLELKNIEEGKSFLLNNIYFDIDSYDINSVSNEIISEFSSYLKVNSKLIISINGFTDDIGEINYNQELSEKRALAVYQKLIESGISLNRLRYKGFGEKFPKYKNKTEKDRELNRRTEFYIIKK
jgi:outer membrane protein OmpA-like peptidoglycan-associated protein